MTISQKKSWVKYENGEFTTALQSKKGSGDNWLPVVYLNTPEECSGGTAFFKNEELMTLLKQPYLNEGEEDKILGFFKDIYKDDYVGCVEMKYNRMVLYHQNVQHAPFMDYNSFVGDNYRINQMFFI